MTPQIPLLVSAVLALLLLTMSRLPALKYLATTKRSGKSHPVLIGLLLFLVVIYGGYTFLMPYLMSVFGLLGALVGGFASLAVIYFIYAYLVKRTGARPTL